MKRVYYTCKEVKAGSRERKSCFYAFGDAWRYWKNYRKLNEQQGSKMDVSGKKEQRKETELDESWLKFTTKVTPNTGVDCKGELHSVAV